MKRNAKSNVPLERILPYMKNANNDSDSSGYSDNDNISRRRGDDTLSVRGGANKTKENSALFRKNRSSQRDPDESQNNRNSDGVSESGISDGRRSEFQSRKNFKDEDESSNKSNNTVAQSSIYDLIHETINKDAFNINFPRTCS